ncbi:glycoside hydrolase family 13 protein [Selenomonas ruminantium]|uniref:Alpha-glucosidase n=1 Tax=Selenomonas ruminantium TaxID=971 RepID=A0A1H3WZM2_SELRU|nr:alpha-glucosidase [Selenomonas ruminantium]SDZ91832.1 alpha-glucosidase [Selenomonas ruminantium]
MKELKWWQKTNVYQVYPKSFLDTTGSGTGDIKGITAKLDYLKTLGVGAIWLTPVYPSPMVDNGYDIADFTGIDPSYGTMADMEKLIAEGRKRDIRMVMDLVYNHSSDKHPWFIDSASSRESEHSDWYIWRDAKPDGSAPTNWRSIFGGSAWTWCEARQQYYLHTFAEAQPDLNWENPAVRQALYDAANFWLDKGVGGFRIDAIVYIKKPAVFADGKQDSDDGMVNIHSMIANTPGILDYLHEFKEKVFKGHDIFTVAEANGVAPEDLDKWVGEKGAFDMLFEFSHVNLEFPDGELWSHATGYTPKVITGLKQALTASQQATAKNGWYPVFFENHDQPRCTAHYFPADADKKLAAKAIATVLMTMRGTPFIYEGQELGLDNVAWNNINDYNDISSKGQYFLALEEGRSPAEAMELVHRYSRDNARTPMQWTKEKNAGFSTGKPWLPVHEDYARQCVESEAQEADSVLSYYRQLAALRQTGEAAGVLQQGTYTELLRENPAILAFKRHFGNREVYTLVNFTGREQAYVLPELQEARLLLESVPGSRKGMLRPYEAVLYIKETGEGL